ncbi:MAG: MMPL family transporter [Polyangia bacterium]|jgi:predicted RND superfamily exporter protein|nr:MMPL family transporter [Polyangia bacterium]
MTSRLSAEALAARLARLASRRWGLVLGAACLLTALGALGLRGLRVQANLVALLPGSLPHVQNLNRIIEKTGGFGDVVVLAESRDLEASARVFADLLPALRSLPWVRHADYQVDPEPLKPFAALYMDKPDLETIRERLQRRMEHAVGASLELDDAPPRVDFSDINKKYDERREKRRHERLFRSDDGRIAAMRIEPKGGMTSDLAFGRRILGDVQRLLDNRASLAKKEGVTLTVTGKFWNRQQDYEAVIGDVTRSAMWGGALILLLITVYFRHALAFPLIIVPLGMSLCWTFAITKLAIGHLNVITAFLFIILLGLGIDFGIHIFARYKSERRSGRDQEPAFAVALRFTGRACVTSGLTTAAAFAALMITDFKGFSQFGFIAALGVVLALGSMLVVLPALLAAAERARLLRWRVSPAPLGATEPAKGAGAGAAPEAARQEGGRQASAAKGIHPAARWMGLGAALGLGLGLLGGAAAAGRRIPFEYDFNKLNTLPAEVERLKAKTRQVFKHSTDSAVVFVDDLEEALALEEVIRAHMARDKTPTIKDVRSQKTLEKALPKEQEAKLVVLREIQTLLAKRAIRNAIEELEPDQKKRFLEFEEQAKARLVKLEDLPETLRRPFHGLPGVAGTLVFIENLRPLKDARFASAFVEDTRRYETDRATYYPASEAVVYAETISLLQRDGVLAVLASLGTVLLLLFLDFRRLGRTFLVFLPLGVALGWLLLVMAVWPIPLNMYNLVVLPSLIGLGIDNSVHLYHRYAELGSGSMGQALRSILGPITATTLTTMVGFGGMISAHQIGLQSIGLLAVLGMGFCLLSVCTVMPALMIFRDDRLARKALGGSSPCRD